MDEIENLKARVTDLEKAKACCGFYEWRDRCRELEDILAEAADHINGGKDGEYRSELLNRIDMVLGVRNGQTN